jgi:hypothetical protein
MSEQDTAGVPIILSEPFEMKLKGRKEGVIALHAA